MRRRPASGGAGVLVGAPGGIPEMRALAGGLANAGCLGTYMTSMSSSMNGGLGLLSRIPGVPGAKTRDILARRPVPSGVRTEQLVHRGTTFDLVSAALVRLTPPRVSRRISNQAYAAFNWRVDQAMARLVSVENSAVIGSYGSCLKTFERARQLGVPTWLVYPIAHHWYAAGLLAEEAKLEPEFAGTLQFDDLPRRLKSRFDREIELADQIVVYGSFHRDTFLSAGVPAEKLIEIPLGVDLDLFAPGPRGDDDVFRVTFVGQISQRKGLSYLLDGFDRANIPHSELLLVGRPIGSSASWRTRAGVRHLQPRPRSELPEVYRRTDVFVLPSLVEGFPLAALEAMSCARPVIVSDHTFGGDVVVDNQNGFVIPIRDPDVIAERLRQLSSNPADRDRLGAEARHTAERYSWEAFGSRAADALTSFRPSVTALSNSPD